MPGVKVKNEDDSWEDIPNERITIKSEEDSESRPSTPTSSLRGVPASSPRKRLRKGISVQSPARKSRIVRSKQAETKEIPSPPSGLKQKPSSPPVVTKEDAVHGLQQFLVFSFKYALDVLSFCIFLLKWPLAIFLFLSTVSFLLSRISSTIRIAFTPLCILPGISRTPLCQLPTDTPLGPPQWADYPKLMDVQSSTFEQLLNDAVSGSSLSLEIKKGEMAAADLAGLVRYSDLTSKEMLATSLNDFVKDAKGTGRGLQKLSSKIGGAVDNIMAVNDYALHTIQAAGKSSTFGAIMPWVKKSKEQEVVSAFATSMDTMGSELRRLILEAEVNLHNLNDLEERLSSIHELVSREETSISSAHADLLADLWTKLGGNRKELRGYNQNLKLLKSLSIYRQKARVHVVGALQTLHAMQEDMEDLRERVSGPQLSGSGIPVEVHMRSIHNGLERLKDGRIKAKQREEEAMAKILEITTE